MPMTPTRPTLAAALLLSAALALPVSAQHIPQSAIDNSRVLMPAPAYVYSLTAPLTGGAPTVQGRSWTGLVRNLTIEALDSPGGMTHDRTTFGVGSGSHCAHTPGVSGGVEFHNPTGTYSRGQPIAIACPTWTTRKCSRSVTFMGRTFTANRDYPPCTGPTETLNVEGYTGRTSNQQAADAPSTYTPGTPGTFTPGTTPTPRAKTPSNGIFKVRVWGNVCLRGGVTCRSFKDGAGRDLLRGDVAPRFGYGATFAPGSNCGPERWPSEAWRQRNGPGYAEYCDVTVDVRR